MNVIKPDATAVAVAALLVLAPFAMAQKGPAPVDLGTLGGSFSQANGINPQDTVVGASTATGDFVTHAFFVHGGKLVDMGTFIGETGNSTAVSANTAITGTSDFNITDSMGNVNTVTHSFYFTSPATGLLDIGTLGGDITYSAFVRNGNVVGSSLTAGDTATHAFLWKASTGVMTDLNVLPGGTTSQAMGTNQTGGKVVGSSDASDGTIHAVLWLPSQNEIVDMGTLGGSFAQANAINTWGLVVGAGNPAGDLVTDAFVGVFDALIDIGGLGGSYAQANAVSDNGVVVGFSNITGDTDVHAFVWTARNGMVDLNTLLPPNSPWELQSANAVAPDGTIAGIGIINGQSHAFSW